MSNVAIHVEQLGKAYRIGLKEQRADTLGAALANWARAPLQNFRQLRNLSRLHAGSLGPDVFWALRDVQFTVNHGEVLGVIGKNGAGKSTLLKILAQITPPTTGRIDLHGRVASLLEVGTGFNPELTGRENIYLNGTILGMTRREIDRKFEEIVDFSGVSAFIDTPVKRFSSGMKVRLAFAVAANLEPEILIIDEVLAVGDADFQQKCLGKMQDVSRKEGRTVLFVSHDMGAVASLCPNSLLLENGQITQSGETSRVVQAYLANRSSMVEKGGLAISLSGERQENLIFRNDAPMQLCVAVQAPEPLENVLFYFLLKKDNKTLLHYRLDNVTLQPQHTFQLEVPALYLLPERYDVEIKLIFPNQHGTQRVTADFNVFLTGEVSHFMNLGLLSPVIQCRHSGNF